MNIIELQKAIAEKQDFYFGSSDTTIDACQDTISSMAAIIYEMKKENDALNTTLASIE